MKIKLTKPFFGPNNALLKAGVHTVPDDWTLPKDTEELEDDTPVVTKKAAAAAK